MPGLKDDDVRTLFKGTIKEATVPVRGIVNTQQTPAGHSPSPVSYFAHTADLSLYQLCAGKNSYDKAGNSWLNILACSPCLCVGHVSNSHFYLAFSSYAGVAGMGWPDEEHTEPMTRLTTAWPPG